MAARVRERRGDMAAGWVSHSVLTGSPYLFAVYSAGQSSVTAAAAARGEKPRSGAEDCEGGSPPAKVRLLSVCRFHCQHCSLLWHSGPAAPSSVTSVTGVAGRSAGAGLAEAAAPLTTRSVGAEKCWGWANCPAKQSLVWTAKCGREIPNKFCPLRLGGAVHSGGHTAGHTPHQPDPHYTITNILILHKTAVRVWLTCWERSPSLRSRLHLVSSSSSSSSSAVRSAAVTVTSVLYSNAGASYAARPPHSPARTATAAVPALHTLHPVAPNESGTTVTRGRHSAVPHRQLFICLFIAVKETNVLIYLNFLT